MSGDPQSCVSRFSFDSPVFCLTILLHGVPGTHFASSVYCGGCRTLMVGLAAPPSRSRLSDERAVIHSEVCWLGGSAYVV